MRHKLRNQEDYWVEHDRPHVNKTERSEAAAGEEVKAWGHIRPRKGWTKSLVSSLFCCLCAITSGCTSAWACETYPSNSNHHLLGPELILVNLSSYLPKNSWLKNMKHYQCRIWINPEIEPTTRWKVWVKFLSPSCHLLLLSRYFTACCSSDFLFLGLLLG